ncbi:MAG: tetratricopeptide repeat protein [Cytophagaceae bacterium]|jgi:tetratricopeptide (TPR) repeat protein|nr:tetratricopeptide repeat protein [Cytophagaceae bacterium]
MKKSQLALVLGAIILVALLYQLPKALVKGKQSPNIQSDSTSTAGPLPSSEMGLQDKILVSDLTKKLNSVSNPQKKLNFADSLAGLYRKVHKFDSAAYFSEMAVSLEPSEKRKVQAAKDYFEAYQFTEGDSKQNFYNSAQRLLKEVLEKNPSNHDAKVDLALTYMSSESPMQGISLLREVVKENPKHENAVYQLGILSMQSGQYDKAVSRFEELLKINSNHVLGNLYLGVSYLKSGDEKNARVFLEKAKKMDNDPEFQASVESYLNELK